MNDRDKKSSIILLTTHFSTKMPEGTLCLPRPLARNYRMNDDVVRLSRQDHLPGGTKRRWNVLGIPFTKLNRYTRRKTGVNGASCESREMRRDLNEIALPCSERMIADLMLIANTSLKHGPRSFVQCVRLPHPEMSLSEHLHVPLKVQSLVNHQT